MGLTSFENDTSMPVLLSARLPCYENHRILSGDRQGGHQS